jgi:hypothetical protein
MRQIAMPRRSVLTAALVPLALLACAALAVPAQASRGDDLPPGWTALPNPDAGEEPAASDQASGPQARVAGGRVVGGTPSSASKWPWHAALVLDADL